MAISVESKTLKRSAAAISAAMILAVPFICTHEGESLQSYADVAGVWTICNGITAGIKPGMTETKEQCSEAEQTTIGQFMAGVSALITVPVSAPTLAAHTSFAYNIGIAGYKRSSALRLTNAGQIAQGCDSMMIWHTAGGKDCSKPENGCTGIVTRRKDEIALCKSGIGATQ